MITKAIKATIPKIMADEKYKNVSDINVGSCFDFAFEVCQKLKDQGIRTAKMRKGKGHTWIEYNGKHYDAESPRGVKAPNRLMYFKRNARLSHETQCHRIYRSGIEPVSVRYASL